MLVKCEICGKQIDKDTAFKRVVGIKTPLNKYCCSEEEYNENKARKAKIRADKDAVYEEVVNIFGYRVQNALLFMEEKEWGYLKPYSVILIYLQEKHDYLVKKMSTIGGGEANRIKYFSTILKNTLYDYEPPIKREARPVAAQDFEMYQEKGHQVSNSRRSFDDLE